MGNGQNVLPLPGVGTQPGGMPAAFHHGFDTTGQIAPAGMKPRVTATLWEDEGSLCFQVEARGICVARREGIDTPGQWTGVKEKLFSLTSRAPLH
jgi:protein SOK2